MKVRFRDDDKDIRYSIRNIDGINDSENPVNCEDLFVKNTKVRAILQCVGLWVASGNYMCQWKLVKAEVDVPEMFSSDDFLADSDNEEDTADHEFVEDSGDDDGADGDGADGDAAEAVEPASPEPSPEPAPEPETPKKKVVKRVVRRKKTGN